MNLKRALLLLAPAVSLTASLPSFAVNFETGTNLGSCVNLNGTTSTCTTAEGIRITGGNLFTEDFRGVTGLGVTGGLNGEVDEGERLFLTLPGRGFWHELQFSRLFGLDAGDADQEFVDVQTFLAPLRGRLTVDPGNDTATWTLFFNDVLIDTREAIALDPNPGAGHFGIFNPFLGITTSGIRLDADAPAGFSNDFAFVAATVTRVPEPGSALLFLTALGAAITAGRRRERAPEFRTALD